VAGKSYEKGRAFEYRVKRKLERAGFFVARSAGSHFPDLVAVKRGIPYAVECKRNLKNLNRRELENLLSLKAFGIVPLVAYPEGGKIVLKRVEEVQAERVGARARKPVEKA